MNWCSVCKGYVELTTAGLACGHDLCQTTTNAEPGDPVMFIHVECPDCKQAAGRIKELNLANARLRDDCRRVSESWKAMKERTETSSSPGVVIRKAIPIEEIQVADFPYPREWELEDQDLKERAENAEAALNRIANEISCRIQHGAESNGHLEAIQAMIPGG